MLKNVGPIDRSLRIFLGVALVVSACFMHGLWCWIALPGAILLLTGATARCPLYIPVGINTTRG